jgi:hypothetical protein
MLIAVLGAVSIFRLSAYVIPNIDIPVVSVAWSYTGMSTDNVETRIMFLNERVLATLVNGIEHVESESHNGRDFGAEIQVLAGPTDGEQVAVHPGDDLPEGTVVEPVPLPTK